jgi:hypothetical protein
MFQRQGDIFRESNVGGVQVPTQIFWCYNNQLLKSMGYKITIFLLQIWHNFKLLA